MKKSLKVLRWPHSQFLEEPSADLDGQNHVVFFTVLVVWIRGQQA
jgi:hypothetical protein